MVTPPRVMAQFVKLAAAVAVVAALGFVAINRPAPVVAQNAPQRADTAKGNSPKPQRPQNSQGRLEEALEAKGSVIDALQSLGEKIKFDAEGRLIHFSADKHPIGDRGLQSLAEDPRAQTIRTMSLWDRESLTDVGVASLQKFSNLEELRLSARRMTGIGVLYLGSLPKLKKLELMGMEVSPVTLRTLRAELPRCNIVHLPGF